MLDLGVDEFLLNAALVSIVAQRLVRRLCPHCSATDEAHQLLVRNLHLGDFAKRWGQPDLNVRRAVGCEHCNYSGFRGRVAIIEYLRCDEAIQALPKDQHFIKAARELNRSRGARNLFEDGLLKAVQGITTIDEVLRVAG